MSYGISIKWLAVSCFELRCNNLSVVTDPFITECVTTDLTWEAVESCNLIALSHAHWDHITDIPRLTQKFRPGILCGDQTAIPMAGWLNYSPSLMYPMYPDTELDFGDVKIRALYGRHKGMGRNVGFNDLCQRHCEKSVELGEPGMAQLQYAANMEYRNYLFTLPNGTKLLIWGSTPKIEQLNLCKGLKPDIAIIQRSGNPEDIAKRAQFAAEIGCKVVIPHHQDFKEVEDPKNLLLFKEEFLRRVPDGTFIIPEHGQWIHL